MYFLSGFAAKLDLTAVRVPIPLSPCGPGVPVVNSLDAESQKLAVKARIMSIAKGHPHSEALHIPNGCAARTWASPGPRVVGYEWEFQGARYDQGRSDTKDQQSIKQGALRSWDLS